ncbi:MAG: FecCD family ABC transporter permease [Nitrososphaerales archaeon]
MSQDQDFGYFARFARWHVIIVVSVILLFITAVISTNVGYSQIPFSTVMKSLLNGLLIGQSPLFEDIPKTDETIILQVRLPRILAGILVGSALAGSGVTFQAVFRNPMADPYVLGVSAGAAVGGASAIILGVGTGFFGTNAISVVSWAGALIAMFSVYYISRVGSRTPTMTLLLSGIAVSIFLSAIVSLLITLSDTSTNKLQVLVFWLLGSVANVTWGEVLTAFPAIIIGLVILTLFSKRLNIMLLGDEEAEHLGIQTQKVRKRVLVVAAIITASAVALAGIIGFVGLMIPHLMRILVGPDHRVLMPVSILGGGIYLASFDALARVLYSPAEFPVGVLTALAGGPFFIYLLRKKKGEYSL